MEPHIIFNTHLPPRSPLPASYLNSTLKTKRERVLKRNQVSFIDCCIGCRNKKKTKKILLEDFFLLVPFLLSIFLFGIKLFLKLHKNGIFRIMPGVFFLSKILRKCNFYLTLKYSCVDVLDSLKACIKKLLVLFSLSKFHFILFFLMQQKHLPV